MKEKFKEFVKKNPVLLKYINSNEMTWQQFYEMFDLYGEEESVWKKYLKKEKSDTVKSEVTNSALTDFLAFLKTINLDSLQEGIENVQRVLGVFQDFSTNKNKSPKEEYKPRPLYKHFEDWWV